jgi:hypothetical protein
MTSILTRAIRYGLIDELDELYELIAELVIDVENHEAVYNAGRPASMITEIIAAFGIVEGAVAVCDAKGGHEHGEPGELKGKGGLP